MCLLVWVTILAHFPSHLALRPFLFPHNVGDAPFPVGGLLPFPLFFKASPEWVCLVSNVCFWLMPTYQVAMFAFSSSYYLGIEDSPYGHGHRMRNWCRGRWWGSECFLLVRITCALWSCSCLIMGTTSFYVLMIIGNRASSWYKSLNTRSLDNPCQALHLYQGPIAWQE